MAESPTTSSYPGTLDSWVSLTDKEDLAEVSDINKIKNAILATQTELGTNPAGSKTDLVARLAVMMADNGSIQNGTSYPGSPVDGQIFYRTDSDTAAIYNGATWETIGGTLSNVLFAWGNVNYTNNLLRLDTNINNDSASAIGYYFFRIDTNTYTEIIGSRFRKIAGINAFRFLAAAWQRNSSDGRQTSVKVDIGGQSTTVTGTINQNTPEWLVSSSVDISSLSDDTEYAISVQLKNSAASVAAFLGAIIVIGE